MLSSLCNPVDNAFTLAEEAGLQDTSFPKVKWEKRTLSRGPSKLQRNTVSPFTHNNFVVAMSGCACQMYTMQESSNSFVKPHTLSTPVAVRTNLPSEAGVVM